MVPWWLPVDLPNISAIIDCLKTWLVSIERSFRGLSIAIETMRIDEELMEIWPNEVCDSKIAKLQAGIKPTALCSAFDKENLIEFLLLLIQLLHSLCTTFPCPSCDLSCDVMWCDAVTLWYSWYDTFLHSLLCSKSKIKEKKEI